MSAGIYNLYVEKGVDQTWVIKIQDSDQKAINISGCSFRAQIRASAISPAIVITPTIIIINATGGEVKMTISATQSSSVPTKGVKYSELTTYAWDLEMVDASSKVHRLLNGVAEFSPEVTK